MLMQVGSLEYASTVVKPDVLSRQKQLLRRARFLLEEDRKIIEMSVSSGISVRQIGDWLGIKAGNASRRIARLGRRLNDSLVVALTDDRCPLPADYRAIGIERFVQGLSEIRIAEKHEMSRREVANIVQFIRGWHRGICSRREM